MRHTNFQNKNASFKVLNNTDSILKLYKFTLTDGLITLASPSITVIGNYYRTSITTLDEDYFILIVWGSVIEIVRVGDPDILTIGYNGLISDTVPYKHFDIDGSLLAEGNMVEMGEGFYYIEPISLVQSFFDLSGSLITLAVPYKVINCTDTGTGETLSDANFINTGYNMFSYLGERYSYFDLVAGVWVNDVNVEATAADLAKAICFKYNLVWADKTDPLWIGNYIKYIRTYYENADQKAFKLYAPSVTPETNSNNFFLHQTDEKGNLYIRGVSILLLQDLETEGAVITFRNA